MSTDPYITWEPVHCEWCGRLRGTLRRREGRALEYAPIYVGACCIKQRLIGEAIRSQATNSLDTLTSGMAR